MDVLILGNCMLIKGEQPEWPEMKGHMERRDGSPQTKVQSGFMEGLRQIYTEEFLPVASSLGDRRFDRSSTSSKGMPSTWFNFTADQSPKAVFSIPEGIDTASPNPELMAQAITEFWTPGVVTEALRPVLASLIKLGQRFPAAKRLEEEVSESVYVMF